MIWVGGILMLVGALIALVSTAGFDEAKKDGEGLYALPVAVLVIGVALVGVGVWLVKTSWP